MLKVFNISNNGFSNDGVVAIAKALEVNSSILELDISYVYLYLSVCVCVSVCLHSQIALRTICMHAYNYSQINLNTYTSAHMHTYVTYL